MDFILDWITGVELIASDHCYLKIFGVMMLITLTLLPILYSVIKPNQDEWKFWDKMLRVIFGRERLNPFEKWTPATDDPLLFSSALF